MDQDLIKKRQRELSKQQAMYVAARERGLPREKSAVMAGYPAGQEAGKQVESSPTVQEELAKARAQLATTTGVTREDVIAGLLAAANMAQTMADPAAMTRAWSELGKMLGYFAPQKTLHEHGLNPEDREAIKRLSDRELHRLAKGRVIEPEEVKTVDE